VEQASRIARRALAWLGGGLAYTLGAQPSRSTI
jgi:hypothetical protein